MGTPLKINILNGGIYFFHVRDDQKISLETIFTSLSPKMGEISVLNQIGANL